MVAESTPQNKPKRDPRQIYPVPLRKAERIIGYHRSHIARVLKGERIAPPTLRAYQALVAKEAAR